MADNVGNSSGKDYRLDVPPKSGDFHVKGLSSCSWGMKNRLSRIFRPSSGNTVMLAFDHGYIMGSTSGLERLDIVIEPLLPFVDVLMATRGALRTCVPPDTNRALCLRATHDASVLHEDMSAGGGAGLDMEDALRINASALAVQTFIGAGGERDSLELLCRTVDMGERYGIPVLGVVAVGKQLVRNARYFLLATRILAEHGAHMVKTYYCEDFERIAAACPVPIVIAGGKKLPEDEALTMAYRAVREGARGVDMGRNIFQSEHPASMAMAVGKVVHEGFTDREAYEAFLEMKNRS